MLGIGYRVSIKAIGVHQDLNAEGVLLVLDILPFGLRPMFESARPLRVFLVGFGISSL